MTLARKVLILRHQRFETAFSGMASPARSKDKIKIARKLDQIGVPFIEGGWPGANAVDTQLY